MAGWTSSSSKLDTSIVITFRELTPEEFNNIPPEVRDGLSIPIEAKVVGAIENGKIVATMGAFPIVFLSTMWVDPSFRGGDRKVLLETAKKYKEMLTDLGILKVFQMTAPDRGWSVEKAEQILGAKRLDFGREIVTIDLQDPTTLGGTR